MVCGGGQVMRGTAYVLGKPVEKQGDMVVSGLF